MAEKLCQLKKKGGGNSKNIAPDSFYIFTYEAANGTDSEASGAVIFDYEQVFPKYSKVKYEIVSSTPNAVQLSNLSTMAATPIAFNITTSWQDIPSNIKTGSGFIRFMITSGNHYKTRIVVKILLQ